MIFAKVHSFIIFNVFEIHFYNQRHLEKHFEGILDGRNRDAHTRTAVLAPYFRTFRTEYKEYGARRPSYLGSTDFSTGYGHFFKHEVRRVRSTRSTVLQEYELKYQVRSFFLAQSTEYGEYRTSGVRI